MLTVLKSDGQVSILAQDEYKRISSELESGSASPRSPRRQKNTRRQITKPRRLVEGLRGNTICQYESNKLVWSYLL